MNSVDILHKEMVDVSSRIKQEIAKYPHADNNGLLF